MVLEFGRNTAVKIMNRQISLINVKIKKILIKISDWTFYLVNFILNQEDVESTYFIMGGTNVLNLLNIKKYCTKNSFSTFLLSMKVYNSSDYNLQFIIKTNKKTSKIFSHYCLL